MFLLNSIQLLSMKQFLLKIKEIDLVYHPGNNSRRVRYNDKDFDVLLIRFSVDNKEFLFAIKADHLPDTDSIHLVYNSLNHQVTWSPKSLDGNIKDLTGLF